MILTIGKLTNAQIIAFTMKKNIANKSNKKLKPKNTWITNAIIVFCIETYNFMTVQQSSNFKE